MDPYLVLFGPHEPAVVVGPFPDGYNALREFACPAGYDTVSSHSTREEADAEVAWLRANQRTLLDGGLI